MSQSQSPQDTARLSVLVNPDRIRSSIKRLFHNHIDEVISELLQNSQRSGSTSVDITTTEDSFTIQDNGHGLLDGIDGFHTLLKLAESNFDNDTIADQDPMGLGIVSLLTHDQVQEVTFSSGPLELTIDTKRWWNEPEYYSTWFERMRTLDQQVTGLHINVTCEPELVKAVHASLKPKDQLAMYTDDIHRSASPAQGYEGILSITLNSKPVRTSLPQWVKIANPLVSTTYKGCKLQIGYDSARHRSSVLWYGQLILQRTIGESFCYHLEVSSGRPINPLSPSRAGIIQDAAYNELIAFIKSEIFKFAFNPKNRARVRATHVEGCYKLDAEYSNAHCPYIVAEAIQTSENPNSLAEFESPSDCDYNSINIKELFTYEELPQLLSEEVIVQLPDKLSEAEHGLRSFLHETGPAYALKYGDESRLTIGTLWWKPAGKPEHECFYKPGEYGISYEPDKPPAAWSAITTTPVFVFNDPNSYDAAEVDFIVGTTKDPIDFYVNEAWAGFEPDDESDHELQQEQYADSLAYIIRSIMGKCVPFHFKEYELSRFFKDQSAPIVSITYHYKIAGKFVNPRRAYKPNSKAGGAMRPSEITVKTSVGEKVRLKLYG